MACISRDVFSVLLLCFGNSIQMLFFYVSHWEICNNGRVMLFPSCYAQTSICFLLCFVFHTFSALAWVERKWDQLVVSWKWSPWRQQALIYHLIFKLVWQQWALWLGRTSPSVNNERQTDSHANSGCIYSKFVSVTIDATESFLDLYWTPMRNLATWKSINSCFAFGPCTPYTSSSYNMSVKCMFFCTGHISHPFISVAM